MNTKGLYFSTEIGIRKPLIKKNIETPRTAKKPGNSTGIKSRMTLGKLSKLARGRLSIDEMNSLEIKQSLISKLGIFMCALITPTFIHHLPFVDKYLKTLEENLIDKHVPIYFTIEDNNIDD